MSNSTHDIVVIGAGISGLSAAKLLAESGLNVLVLEARDRVGGRTFTKRDPAYSYVDVGGSYIGPTQDRILRLSKELGLETYKIYTTGDYVHFANGKRLRFQGTWPTFRNPLAWLDINNLFRTLDEMLLEIPVECPWNAPHAEEWDSMTVQQWYDQMCWTQDAKDFAKSFTNANVAMEPSEISMLWFFWYVKSCGGTKKIWETEGGGQERKFIGGSMQVSERIADILGDRVKFNCPVQNISEKDGTITIETIPGEIFKANYVILAVAPSLHLKIAFDPPLSPLRNQLIQRVPMGSCLKNEVWYKTAFWRKKGMNGFGAAPHDCIGNFVDDCKPDGSHPGLVGFVMGDDARRFSTMTKEERKQATCECFAKLFGEEALDPVGYEEHNWLAEPYSGGCYTSTYPPGVMTRYGRVLREPHGRVHFAGTELAIKWTGYMDGAVESGERAAREILHLLGKIPKEQIWQVEPPSKEVPDVPFKESFLEKHAPSVGGLFKLLGRTAVVTSLGYLGYRYQDKIPGVIQRLPSW